MKVEFRRSFTKDLKSITDKSLLKRVKKTIETVEQSKTLNNLPNRKKLKSW